MQRDFRVPVVGDYQLSAGGIAILSIYGILDCQYMTQRELVVAFAGKNVANPTPRERWKIDIFGSSLFLAKNRFQADDVWSRLFYRPSWPALTLNLQLKGVPILHMHGVAPDSWRKGQKYQSCP